MEDLFLSTQVDDERTVCISTLDAATYKTVGGKGLGGDYGYFIYETYTSRPQLGIEIIAKAASWDAALKIFDLITCVRSGRRVSQAA